MLADRWICRVPESCKNHKGSLQQIEGRIKYIVEGKLSSSGHCYINHIYVPHYILRHRSKTHDTCIPVVFFNYYKGVCKKVYLHSPNC